MSKTPFEIRLELLKLAHHIESDKATLKNRADEEEWHIKRERAVDDKNLPIPPFPYQIAVDAEQVIKSADLLNAFVSRKE